MSTQKHIFTLYKLEKLLSKKNIIPPTIEKPTSSFFLSEELNPQYVKPNFSTNTEEIKEGKLPKVILISAAGATGKSELTKYLSAQYNIPIFDLAQHAPVASNSLTGLFFDTLGANGLAEYVTNLTNGSASMIIDALDEGHLKTTIPAFDAFMDGIVSISKNALGTPFIILGRTNIVDHCALYLWEKDISAEIYHIEPFTVEQAKEFIDLRINDRLNQQYRTVRDHIITSVEGFFKNESDIVKSESKAFIGYAPVLLSISVLLKKTANYKALYEELLKKNDRGVELILEIITLILNRDREQKIIPILQQQLLADRDTDFVKEAENNAYSINEQCERILSHILGIKPKIRVTSDLAFNHQYEELADEWLKEHPFIQSGKIQNAVFESFLIAKLMRVPEHEKLVLSYLRSKYKNAFMLFFIYEKLSDDKRINPLYLQYLYSSLKSLDDKSNFYGLNIDTSSNFNEESVLDAEIDFYNTKDNNVSYPFSMEVMQNSVINFDNQLSNVNINLPVKIEFQTNRLELGSPITINCSEITINTKEFVFEFKQEGDVILECDNINIDYSTGVVPKILNFGDSKAQLIIISNNQPDYPFTDFHSNISHKIDELDEDSIQKYIILRKILMQLRSHSKGELAKLKDKIEHPRILKNNIGWEVLNKLTNSRILFLDAHLYKLNTEELNNKLGLSYIDLKKRIINQKTIDFLK